MIVLLTVAVIFCTSAPQGSALLSGGQLENSPMMTTPELANLWGYETEEHDVFTEDGYILSVFRVKKRNESVPLGARVLLFFCGILASSDFYLFTSEKPFALYLVDDGYDVWLGNIRGSRYGKRHKILSATDVDFWDFSNHELGFYDVPATIDYILDVTANRKLGYLGYSQGGTSFFIMMSEKPQYNDKVSVMIGLSPAVYFQYTTNNILLKFLARHGAELLEFVRTGKYLELLTIHGPNLDLFKRLCIDSNLFPYLCRPLAWELVGTTNVQQSDDSVRQLLKYLTSSSLKVPVHYSQGTVSGKFRQFKYDTDEKNLQNYGSLEPPEYKVQNAKVPVLLFSAINDKLVNHKDVETLMKELPNVLYFKTFPYGYYGHFSTLTAENASRYFYDTIVPVLSKIPFSYNFRSHEN